jgi:hypothetical protein
MRFRPGFAALCAPEVGAEPQLLDQRDGARVGAEAIVRESVEERAADGYLGAGRKPAASSPATGTRSESGTVSPRWARRRASVRLSAPPRIAVLVATATE